MLTPLLFALQLLQPHHLPDTGKLEGFSYVEEVRLAEKNDKSIPVMIVFHYSGGSASSALQDYVDIAVPVRIIAPIGNYPKRAGRSYFPPDYYTLDSATQVSVAKRTVDSLAVFIKAVMKGNPGKVIVSGISQGGDLSWLLAVHHPQLVKAALPFAAFIHRQAWDAILKMPANPTPIYLFQGDDDPIIAVKFSAGEKAASPAPELSRVAT